MHEEYYDKEKAATLQFIFDEYPKRWVLLLEQKFQKVVKVKSAFCRICEKRQKIEKFYIEK